MSDSQMDLLHQIHDLKSQLTKMQKQLDIIHHYPPTMILMRGIPGSGKSTLARQLAIKRIPHDMAGLGLTSEIFSTDDYFTSASGDYIFRPDKLSQAHMINQQNVKDAMYRRVQYIIVDNTNIYPWEMYVYVCMAIQHGYMIEISEVQTAWRHNVDECFRRNIHNIPKSIISAKLKKYVEGMTVADILVTAGKKPQYIKKSCKYGMDCRYMMSGDCYFMSWHISKGHIL